MAIAKKPTPVQQPAIISERKAQNFIAGAENPRKATDKKPLATTLRFKPDFLQRIDAAAATRNITRSAWIKSTLSRVLDEEGIS